MVQKYQTIDSKKELQKIAQIIEHYQQQGIILKKDEIHNLKFIHKKIVFVSGMDQETLERNDLSSKRYFGQYGKVLNCSFKKETGNLHIVYENKKQASFAIIAMSGFRSTKKNFRNDKQQLKVCFGTSRFCISFLKDQKCRNQDCQFIHELKNVDQIFSKTKINLSSAYRTAQKSKDYLNKWMEIVGQDHSEFPSITEVEQKLNYRLKNRQNTQKDEREKHYSKELQKSNPESDLETSQQITRPSQNHSETEIHENYLFNQLVEEKSIDQKIVNRFLFVKIRNHKSRFEFAQE